MDDKFDNFRILSGACTAISAVAVWFAMIANMWHYPRENDDLCTLFGFVGFILIIRYLTRFLYRSNLIGLAFGVRLTFTVLSLINNYSAPDVNFGVVCQPTGFLAICIQFGRFLYPVALPIFYVVMIPVFIIFLIALGFSSAASKIVK